MKEKTIFEKIIDREIPADILYEDQKHIVILDINPFEKGHILVIPKKNYETILDMSEEDFLDLQKIVLKFAKKVHSVFGGGLNVNQNNYKEANQEVPHVHFHIFPRTENKKLYHSENHTGKYTSEEEKKEIIENLKI